VLTVPSMLSARERGLLYWLARDYFTAAGRIVDAGCFLGGSTAALVAGLRDRAPPLDAASVVSYDLFRVEGYTLPAFAQYLPSTEVGSSFREAFDTNLVPFGRVEVLEGDVCAFGWSGQPIEILFLDVVKTWDVHEVVWTQFFPCLLPGRSVIVQQDYLWSCAPWIHMTMELVAEFVEILDWMPNGSVAYLLRAPIPPDVLGLQLRGDFSAEQQLSLMARAVDRWRGEERGLVELARVMLVAEILGAAGASEEFQMVRARYAASEWVQECARFLAATMNW